MGTKKNYYTLLAATAKKLFLVEQVGTLAAATYYGMSVDGNGILYAADLSGKKIARFNLTTGQVLPSFTLPYQPIWAGVVNGELLVTDNAGNALIRAYNPQTGALIRSFGSVGYSYGLVFHDTRYYVLDFSAGLKIYSAAGVLEKTVPYTGNSQSISLKDGIVWRSRNSTTMGRYDTGTQTSLGEITTPAIRAHDWNVDGELVTASGNSFNLYSAGLALLEVATVGEATTAVASYGSLQYGLSTAGRIYKISR